MNVPCMACMQARPDVNVEVNISPDLTEASFDFYSSPFHIRDDSDVLREV